MRILISGHSMAASRQQRFWEYFASLGHKVVLLAPRNWGTYNTVDMQKDSFTVKAVDYIGLGRRVRGFLESVEEVKPDWVYLNDESDDGQIIQACQAKKTSPFKLTLFSWDNLPNQYLWQRFIDQIDLFVPGNMGARSILLQKGIPEEKIASPVIQVGVDTELFTPMPENPKQYDTVTCAALSDSKGVCQIQQVVKDLGFKHLWLGTQRSNDTLSCKITYGDQGFINYEQMPLFYNRARIHVLFSRDMPKWKEQFTYSIAESLACGLYNVISDAGEWPSLWKDVPGVMMVPQNDVEALKEDLRSEMELTTPRRININGRRTVQERYSYAEVGAQLQQVFGGSS